MAPVRIWKGRMMILAVLLLPLFEVEGRTHLQADGETDTYTLIQSVFGENGTRNVPDCSHPSYGPHITQRNDKQLNKPVFVFHVHIDPDGEECSGPEEGLQLQQVEIRPDLPAPSNQYKTSELVAKEGEMVSLAWKFRLNSAFRVSPSFTHIHQLRAADGGSERDPPLITVTLVKKSGSGRLEVRHTGEDGLTTNLKTGPLSRFAGVWIHAFEEVTYGRSGSYSLNLTRADNGKELLAVRAVGLYLGAKNAKYIRPKWGIYRDVEGGSANSLRDEHVKFDHFCLGKGGHDRCCRE